MPADLLPLLKDALTSKLDDYCAEIVQIVEPLDDRQLFSGERCDIRGSQTISLFPYSLTLDLPKAAETTREHQRKQLDDRMSTLIREIHVELLRRRDRGANRILRTGHDVLLVGAVQHG